MATAHGGTSAGTPRAKRPRRAHGPTTPSPTPAAAHDLDLLRRTLLVRRFEERCVGLYSAAANRGSVRLTAEELAGEGINAEVVDLRTLRLLDDATIVGSVRRTHRAVVVDEGWRSGTEATEDDYPALDTWDGCAARLVAEDGASAQGRGG